jgi:hypothetical protein
MTTGDFRFEVAWVHSTGCRLAVYLCFAPGYPLGKPPAEGPGLAAGVQRRRVQESADSGGSVNESHPPPGRFGRVVCHSLSMGYSRFQDGHPQPLIFLPPIFLPPTASARFQQHEIRRKGQKDLGQKDEGEQVSGAGPENSDAPPAGGRADTGGLGGGEPHPVKDCRRFFGNGLDKGGGGIQDSRNDPIPTPPARFEPHHPAISNPLIVPRPEEKVSISNPIRCSRVTCRLDKG